jgi:hypothetical protein
MTQPHGGRLPAPVEEDQVVVVAQPEDAGHLAGDLRRQRKVVAGHGLRRDEEAM